MQALNIFRKSPTELDYEKTACFVNPDSILFSELLH